ncbi:30S ribosomal protein S9 [bacterium]
MTGTSSIFWGVGRRKRSVARVRILPGKGRIFVNKKTIDQYFNGLPTLVRDITQPLQATKTMDKYDIRANVNGGGTTGQAGAVCHGISRALAKADESNKNILRKHGFLTRDSRKVERKKPGQPKARKKFQFSKR